MPLELNLNFSDITHVIVSLSGEELEQTGSLDFVSPISDEDRKEIRWYLEEYATRYSSDVDDARAQRFVARMPEMGTALFKAVFSERDARGLVRDFLEDDEPGRLLTITAEHPAILSLPWELLHTLEKDGNFLIYEKPRISIRRRITGIGSGSRRKKPKQKDCLHMLFLVSRPSDVGFIDPRSDPNAVLNALEKHAAGRVTWEFLRPATLEGLVKRLDDEDMPHVDIIHFDGHGVFDSTGELAKTALQGFKSLPENLVREADNAKVGKNTGYLLFEQPDCTKHLVPAKLLADELNKQKVGLVVLSACQSAAVGEDEAMGSVAAALTGTGIPSVIAMTHSVLVAATEKLFAEFYEGMAKGQKIGAALDNARLALNRNTERRQIRRWDGRVTIRLHDWFLPALYQPGFDTALLSKGKETLHSPDPESEVSLYHNLPNVQEAGFFGRRGELWKIESWFVHDTRRITITGFGGQGKTFLAQEAGRWLMRTGMFEAVVFVDYAGFQGVDAVDMAVSTMRVVLRESPTDADAATRLLKQLSCLVILDNLEAVGEIPPENLTPDPFPSGKGRPDADLNPPSLQGRGAGGLDGILDAAVQWSEAGKTRVLITTRQPVFDHEAYPIEAANKHRRIALDGLQKADCLRYFQSLMMLPPEPRFGMPEEDEITEVFRQVGYHPLSVNQLARQVKATPVKELGERLEKLLEALPENMPKYEKSLVASLNLSLEKLAPEMQSFLPKLGVFQGGVWEPMLQRITDIPETTWQQLRQALEATALIQSERLNGITAPYLKFHPTLAPVLWQRLTEKEQSELSARYRQAYYELSGYLYFEDVKQNPEQVRAIAKKELPNLLHAVYRTLENREEKGVDFADKVIWFLDNFGLNRDRETLTTRAEAMAGDAGSQSWYLACSHQGKLLFDVGFFKEAQAVFKKILRQLGETISCNRCHTLDRLGRCMESQGQPEKAAYCYRLALKEAEELEPSKNVKRQMGVLQTDLADVLTDMGDYDGARKAYEVSLFIKKEIGGDKSGEATVQLQLGTLELVRGNLPAAEERYLEALKNFQDLNEPKSEAGTWHQLGILYQKANTWEQAEKAYRQSAQIRESKGYLAEATQTWNQLAIVSKNMGRLPEAEAWYRKAIDADRKNVNNVELAKDLSNLADLLENQPERLDEAQQAAEEALALFKTLDPSVAQLWKIYTVLADIADKQNDPAQAKEYRRLAREAKANAKVTAYELQQYQWLIDGVVGTVGTPESYEPLLKELKEIGLSDEFLQAVRKIFDGERDLDILCEGLNLNTSMLVYAIVERV